MPWTIHKICCIIPAGECAPAFAHVWNSFCELLSWVHQRYHQFLSKHVISSFLAFLPIDERLSHHSVTSSDSEWEQSLRSLHTCRLSKLARGPGPVTSGGFLGQSGTTLPSPVLSRKAADSWTSLLEASASRFILTKVTHEFCHLFLFSLALPEFLWLFCPFIEGFKLSFKLWLTVTIIIF